MYNIIDAIFLLNLATRRANYVYSTNCKSSMIISLLVAASKQWSSRGISGSDYNAKTTSTNLYYANVGIRVHLANLKSFVRYLDGVSTRMQFLSRGSRNIISFDKSIGTYPTPRSPIRFNCKSPQIKDSICGPQFEISKMVWSPQ